MHIHDIFRLHLTLMEEPHGTPYAGKDCAPCKAMGEALAEWFNAHPEMIEPKQPEDAQ